MDYTTPKGFDTDYYYTPQKEIKPEIKDSTYFNDITDKNCCFRKITYICKRRIYIIGQNRYYYPKYIVFKFIWLYFVLCSIITPIVFYFSSEIDLLIIILCPAMLALELIASCIVVIEVFIALQPCSLVITYGTMFCKKSKAYYYTEIEHVDVINLDCYLVLKNGEKQNISGQAFIFNCCLKGAKEFDAEERSNLVNFAYFVNSYIKNHL